MIHIRRLVIADHSEVFAQALAEALKDDYAVSVCMDGPAALELLSKEKADILIISFSLMMIDGLSVVAQLPTSQRPELIIGLCAYSSAAVCRYAQQLGISYIVTTPTQISSLVRLIGGFSEVQTNPKLSLEKQVGMILTKLGFPYHIEAYKRLCCAVPVYRRDPSQAITKELYPYVAKVCNATSTASVENSIRSAIADAWEKGDPYYWQEYFPGMDIYPTSKQFIARIAELLVD